MRMIGITLLKSQQVLGTSFQQPTHTFCIIYLELMRLTSGTGETCFMSSMQDIFLSFQYLLRLLYQIFKRSGRVWIQCHRQRCLMDLSSLEILRSVCNALVFESTNPENIQLYIFIKFKATVYLNEPNSTKDQEALSTQRQ